MYVGGQVSRFLIQGLQSVVTPFHPFGGAVDIIVVKQHDGTFRSTPWYVRFGKFQGVLKGADEVVKIEVNGVEANFHMYLDSSGEAYFVREVHPGRDDNEGIKDSDNLEGRRDDYTTEYSNIDNDLKENDFYGQEANDFNNGEVEVRDERFALGMDRLERVESDSGHIFYEFQDEQSSLEGSLEFPEYGSSRYDNLDSVENALELQDSESEVVLVSVDGHVLTAPISSSLRNGENVQLSTPQFHIGPGGGTEEHNKGEAEEHNRGEATRNSNHLSDLDASAQKVNTGNIYDANSGTVSSEYQLEPFERDGEHLCHAQISQDSTNTDKELCIDSSSGSTCYSLKRDEVFKSCLALSELALHSTYGDQENMGSSLEILETTEDPDKKSPQSPLTNDATKEGNHEILRIGGELSPHDSGYPISVSLPELQVEAATYEGNAFNMGYDGSDSLPVKFVNNGQGSQKQMDVDLAVKRMQSGEEAAASEDEYSKSEQVKPCMGAPFEDMILEHTVSNSSNEEAFVGSESLSQSQPVVTTPTTCAATVSPRKQIIRTNVPTTDQIASLNLKEGQNMVNFVFSTRFLGSQKVEAHIYLWKWNTRIVISDVDGTITKSDVLGQFMPLVGKDWTHSGIAHLFSAIKENGYQLLFLSARAIVQAYLTKSFLFNLKQDGKSLPSGPVVISPDGLFPSLYREVIRRAPHEFKIACLEDIKALFPPDYNPFYAGFGNRDTDELSYRKIGIPKGKIFIINPKGEVAINRRIDVKSYTSLHTLVNDMFPPTSLVEQEDYNSWNFWRVPLPEVDDL